MHDDSYWTLLKGSQKNRHCYLDQCLLYTQKTDSIVPKFNLVFLHRKTLMLQISGKIRKSRKRKQNQHDENGFIHVKAVLCQQSLRQLSLHLIWLSICVYITVGRTQANKLSILRFVNRGGPVICVNVYEGMNSTYCPSSNGRNIWLYRLAPKYTEICVNISSSIVVYF